MALRWRTGVQVQPGLPGCNPNPKHAPALHRHMQVAGKQHHYGLAQQTSHHVAQANPHRMPMRLCIQTRAQAGSMGPGTVPSGRPIEAQSAWKSFWTFTGILAMLGSVGGALAALLGYFSTSVALALPLVLPVISLIASLQREGLISEVNRQQYDSLSSTLRRDTVSLLGEVRSSVLEVKSALRVQASSAAKLTNLEARLSSLEGSLLSTGRSIREVSAAMSVMPDKMSSTQRAQLEALLASVRQDLRRAADMRTNEESAGLAAVSSRLAAIDGSLAGLEVSQGELVRRLSISMNSALVDAESSLQAAVRTEVEKSMEPVRRLPSMLAAALPAMVAAAQPPPVPMTSESVSSPAQGYGPGYVTDSQVGSAGSVMESEMPRGLSSEAMEQLRGLMRQEVQVALQTMLEYQAKSNAALSAEAAATAAANPTTVRLEGEQWDALGRRLSRLEALVDSIPQAASGLMLTQLPAQLGPRADESAQSAALSVSAAVSAEGERLGQLLQSGFQSVQADVETLSALMRPMSQAVLDEQAVSGDRHQAVQSQLQRVMDGLSAVDERLEGIRQAVEQSMAEALAAARISQDGAELAVRGSEESEGRLQVDRLVDQVTASSASIQTQLSGLKQLTEQVAQLQGSVQSLMEKSDGLQEVLRKSSEQQATAGAAAAVAARTQTETVSVSASSTSAVVVEEVPQATTPGYAFVEGLLSRDGTPEPSQSPADLQDAPPPAVTSSKLPEPDVNESVSAIKRQLVSDEQQAVADAARAQPVVEQPVAEAAPAPFTEQQPEATASVPPPAPSATDFAAQPQQPQYQPPAPVLASADEVSFAAPAPGINQTRSMYTEPVPSPAYPADSRGGVGAESAGGQVPRGSLPDVRGMNDQDIMAEGLKLLRSGRAETQKGQDWALADALLNDAQQAFSYVLERAPRDTRALGNCGNVLLAQGELKQQYLQALRSGPLPVTDQELQVQSSAEAAMRAEALTLLTRAGEMFKSVLEIDGWSSRALVNWGRAMCIRAEMTLERDVVQKLYKAALDKFEAVLEEEPGMVAARYRAALAMLELSRCYPPASREAITLLMDTANYFNDLLKDNQPEAAALHGTCNALLAQCQQELARARNLRG